MGDSRVLNDIISGSKLEEYLEKGHGTNMLDQETRSLILSWLDEKI